MTTQTQNVAGHNSDTLTHQLAEILADSYVLYLQTQGVHWNIEGPTFHSVHTLTEEQYRDLAVAIDEIAERIRALGKKAPASFSDYGRLATLNPETVQGGATAQVSQLVESNKILSKSLQAAVATAEDQGDHFTADLLTARIGVHDKSAWMLGALIAE